MKKGMKDNIDRKQPSINKVVMHNGIPLFSFIELNINEICLGGSKFIMSNLLLCRI